MKREKGFTLIELMMAILILTIVIGAVYSSFRTGLRVWDSVDDRIQTYQRAMFILDKLSCDLRSSFIAPDNPKSKFVFVGEDNALDFVSSIGSQDKGGYDLRGVSYYLTGGSLIRKECLTPFSPSSLDNEEKIDIGVKDLRFRYFNGELWQDSFSSDKALPLAVELTIGLGEETYSTVISLPGGVYHEKG